MTEDTYTPVARLDEIETFANGHEDAFASRLAPLSKRLGLTKLGAMLTIVPAGKRAFPFHVHHANDELFVILKGEGEYRYGEQTHRVEAGDICAAPAGTQAHQLINTGETDLHYLGISTSIDPEVVEYPDSNKFAALSIGAGNDFTSARLRYVGRTRNSLDYWDGEGQS